MITPDGQTSGIYGVVADEVGKRFAMFGLLTDIYLLFRVSLVH